MMWHLTPDPGVAVHACLAQESQAGKSNIDCSGFSLVTFLSPIVCGGRIVKNAGCPSLGSADYLWVALRIADLSDPGVRWPPGWDFLP